jgi:hypothetical protein
LLVAGRQSLERFEELDRMLAHTFKLTVFPVGSNTAPSMCAPLGRLPT